MRTAAGELPVLLQARLRAVEEKRKKMKGEEKKKEDIRGKRERRGGEEWR